MKKTFYSLLAISLVAFSSCQDEVAENSIVPAKTGEEIQFGSSLDNPAKTRTVYGDNPINGAYPVYWEADGSDEIAVYCPQASQGHVVNYKITPKTDDATTSAAVTKSDASQAGLQWGDVDEHHFSAFYPAKAIKGSQDGNIIGEVPSKQDPVEWKTVKNNAGGSTYIGVGDTDLAFMWAYTTQKKSEGGNVALKFHPWATILDIVIPGPENETPIEVTGITINALNDDILNGDFICDMKPVEQGTASFPSYKVSGSTNQERHTINISLYDKQNKQYFSLGRGDTIKVRAYLLPSDDGYNTDTDKQGTHKIKLTVRTTNSGALTKTLSDPSDKGGILAHKVNKVILPQLRTGSTDYWMSSLDENIYVTELSLPGSKMSYNTAANVGDGAVYQDLNAEEQFKAGIRAFVLQTGCQNDGTNRNEDMNLYVAVNNKERKDRLKDVIKKIADQLEVAQNKGKKNEYAFVMLTYSSGASDGYGGFLGIGETSPDIAWIEAVRDEINEMAAEPSYRIYTDEITPQTTIKDVAGKIILKVNYNYDYQANHLAVDARIPAMFTQWTEAYVPEGLDMRWGSPNPNAAANLKWFYQEVTTIGNDGEATLDEKKAYIQQMWEKSVEYYKNNSDSRMWFFNDLGGSMTGYGNKSESTAGINAFTQEIGPFATAYLQKRQDDATLGIVVMNHANPANQYMGGLIQTIISNNFRFPLRLNHSSTTRSYNASYHKGGNAIGWDN